MKYCNNIIETIGNTPLIRLNSIPKHLSANFYVKAEYFNPGNSIKDRMALKMVEDAESKGLLKKGGTIIEATSGNTGMGLALVAISKGYKCIFTVSDKQSREKIDILRAVGAEVIVCPTNVHPSDPKSYYSVARKLNEEIPNSFYPNQYDNSSNAEAHYLTTGPEIWEQTEGGITHFVAGVGTGGTMCGTSKFLKEKNPSITTVGVDSYGSVFKKYKETGEFDENEIYPYMLEGIGEDILPENVNFELIDHFVKVTDKDAAIYSRRLAREEGLFIGWSCGAAVAGAIDYAERNNLGKDDHVVIILPDHGTRYLNKIYNDNWMKDHGFMEERDFATASDLIKKKDQDNLVIVEPKSLVSDAIKLMKENGISQIPVVEEESFVGSVSDTLLLNQLLESDSLENRLVGDIMAPPFPFISINTTIDTMASMLNNQNKALLVRDDRQGVFIITRNDLLSEVVV
ncbi:cystathionine beta-synthase [Sediminitomix flava]|uniref:Cystathionine beta-synthase n=1 Tax=Sediminitomix flava TaxID=379075 RepID=A0A315ZGK5_SEDFL|nr:cystathionine beta-synthase [Sediminitomix flava]PWJ44289.1 cystathionine beta-synthase [Sediminitomix flava]